MILLYFETAWIILLVISMVLLFVFLLIYFVKKSNRNTNGRQIRLRKTVNEEVYYSGTKKILKIKPKKCEKVKRSVLNEIKLLYKSIWRALSDVKSFEQSQTNVIKEQIEGYKNYLVLRTLRSMDISKINMNGSRINVSALKRNGFKNISDLFITYKRFENINGIGDATAKSIRRNMQLIHSDVFKTTYIKLTVDDKNEHSSILVQCIAIYLDALEYCKKADELLGLKPKVESTIKELNSLLHSPKTLFNPTETYEKAESLYLGLIKLFEDNFENLNEELIEPFNLVKKKTNAESWEDFSESPVSFVKVIEQLSISDRISNIAEYGLSESVAEKVKGTPLFLDGMKADLRKYQEWGTKYIICQQKTILGDEMGLGKTVQAIAAMVSLSNEGATHFMVVCPLSVLTNWCREINRFSSLKVFRVHDKYPDWLFTTWIKEGGVIVTTYETLKNLSINSEYNIDLLVVDEAHLIKNQSANRTMNVRALMPHASRVTFLTGTVLENNVNEMLTLIGYLNSDVVSEAKKYTNYSNSDFFREKVSSVYFRRRRLDVLSELPEKTEVEEWCDINDVERNEYDKSVIEKQYMEARRVSWNVPSEHSSKMSKLKEIVEMAKEDNRKVLVFSFFLDVIDKVKSEFNKEAYGPINGSVSAEERQRIIDSFDKAPAGSVLVCQIVSGGIGLNIQSASVVVICEPQFKPSTENQAISRSYRMGQTRKVLVYHLLATDTVDEGLNNILASKQKEFDYFADQSFAAEKSFQIDSNMFSNLMQQEYEKIINRQKGVENTPTEVVEMPAAKEIKVEKPQTKNNIFVPSSKGGVSVTNRINMISQPRGGYLPIDMFEVEQLATSNELKEENVAPSLIGTAVDYLSRFMNGGSKEESFKISLLGATYINELDKAERLLKSINKTLDDKTIVSTLKLCGYDVCFRAGPMYFKTVDLIEPDADTIFNVREMVIRSLKFFELYGPITKDGFDFKGGYTDTISSGDGDFLTKDTLWDFKVSKSKPTNKHTLQLLIYYLMGMKSIHPEFKTIKYLGIFNPRLNIVYRVSLDKIDDSIKKEVEESAIGYNQGK